MILPQMDRKYWFYVQPTNPLFSFGGVNESAHQNDGTLSCLSFSVEEEEGAAAIATVRFLDPLGVGAKALRWGQPIKVSWGMDLTGSAVAQYVANLVDDEITGSFERTMQGVVMAAPGAFQGGHHIRTLKIRMGRLEDRAKRTQAFTSGTVGTVITQVAAFINAKVLMQFPAQDQPVTNVSPLTMNDESPLEFLRRMAIKFNVKLGFQFVGFTPVVMFIDWNIQHNIDYATNRGLVGKIHYFDYGNSKGNIVGDPDYDQGDGSGMGSVPVPYTDPATGQIAFRFTPAGSQITTQYVLNTDSIEGKLVASSPAKQQKLLQQVLKADMNDFMDGENIRPPFDAYFTRQNFTTVPEQLGWQWNCEVVPNPIYQIGDPCWLGPRTVKGDSVIPPDIKSIRSSGVPAYWRLAKYSWEHDGSGVKQKIMVKR